MAVLLLRIDCDEDMAILRTLFRRHIGLDQYQLIAHDSPQMWSDNLLQIDTINRVAKMNSPARIFAIFSEQAGMDHRAMHATRN